MVDKIIALKYYVNMINEDIVQAIKNNLFPRSRDAITDYINFPWDKDDYGNIRVMYPTSSQAIVIDIWGCIFLSKYRDDIINAIFIPENPQNNWQILFEYREANNFLHEYTQTCIDLIIYSGNILFVIESKFSENYLDQCSWTIGKERNGFKPECNGNYEIEPNSFRKGNNYKCACDGVRFPGKFGNWTNIKYWDYIPKIYTLPYDENGDIKPCIFLYQYQIMRNLCIGKILEEKYNYIVKNYLAFINSEKYYISNKIQNENYINETTKYFIDKNRLSFINYNGIIHNKKGIIDIAKKIVSHDHNELIVWNELEIWINNKINRV